MKNQRIFPGIILIGFGAYFLLQQSHITLLNNFIRGRPCFLLLAQLSLVKAMLLRTMREFFRGDYVWFWFAFSSCWTCIFLAAEHDWNANADYFIRIFLRFQKANTGLFQAFLFLILAVLLLFYDKIAGYFGFLQNGLSVVWKYWPVLLIIVGFILY